MTIPSLNHILFISIRWLDVIDIVLVAILLYQLYKLIKGTVAIRIFLGILAIYLFWKLVSAMQMELLSEILGQFIGVGVLALIIVFQQEIRRFLLLVGSQSAFAGPGFIKKIMNWSNTNQSSEELKVEEIVKACTKMSRSKTGALLVIAKEAELRYHVSSGLDLDAKLSSSLLESIFYKNSPLHDGAAIIHQNQVLAARCILPVSDSASIPSQLGLRHRAAVGITENTTAIAVTVSEETGKISTIKSGELLFDVNQEQLKDFLEKEFIES